jgi:glycosyltransferase involved in cell wall biosynthesis
VSDAARILHVSQPVEAGVAIVLADLAEYQQASGWDVHVACPPGGWLSDRLAGTGVQVHTWHASRGPGTASLSEARHLLDVVRRLKPDVVHLHSSKAGLAGRLAIRGSVPTVFQPHAWSFHAMGGLLAISSAAWERIAVRWTDLVVAVSGGELHEGYRRGIAPPRSVVVPNGVDLGRFSPSDRAGARARLGIGGEPLAVCLGRLALQKGQDQLLRAWPSVMTSVPQARLVLVGEGPERASLTANLPPGACMAGATTTPEDWYAAADVVVVPSRWEGMALVPIEAMACERSVVGFDVAGLAECLGDAGAVIPTGDVRGLAREVAARLADPVLAAREGRRGRTRAVALYDRAQALTSTDEAIKQMLSGGQRLGNLR